MTLRIVWKEGMALSQHHFQQADHFNLLQMRDLAGLSRGLDFGFRNLAISSTALASGMIALESCDVLFPSGLGYTEGALQGLHIESRGFTQLFAPEKMSLAVYLGIKVDNGHVSAFSDVPGAQFQSVLTDCADRMTGSAVLQVPVATPVARIVFEGESQSDLEILPLALLKRNAQGIVELDTDFCPPLLALNAYRPFVIQLEKIKSELATRIARVQAFKPSLSGNGIGQVLYLQALQSFMAVYERLLASPGLAPYWVFLEMARLAGNLLVFRTDTLLIPAYDHSRFGASFGAAFAMVRKLLEIEQASAYSGRRMEKEGQTAYVAGVDGLGLGLGRGVFIAVESSLSAEEFQKAFPVQAKIAPRSKLQGIIISAMQGIVCQPSSPPAGIQESPDTHFFSLSTESALWTDLLQELRLGIYAPAPLQVRSIGILVENPQ